jgi:hypothetical protein
VGVNFVGAEADDDLAEGGLERAGVGGWGDAEASGGAAGGGVGEGSAVGVVVVAEALASEAGGAAAVVVGEEVAALGCVVGHGVGWGPPPGYFLGLKS